MTVLEFFTGFISAFNNPVYDWIFGGALAAISGGIAFYIGGQLGYSGKIGFIMWLITGILVYAAIACVIRFIIWLISIPWWVWLIVFAATATVVATLVVFVRRKEQK